MEQRGDGELSEDEAAVVTDIIDVFRWNHNITSFDEFKYFTGIKSLGPKAFDSCSSLTSISLPNSLTTIEPYAFHSCENLTTISLPNSLTTIGSYAFEHCDSLTSVSLPNRLTSIEEFAFSGCSNLE